MGLHASHPSPRPPVRRVLVTGGAGFIGSHLVDALLARGAHVRVLDNLSTGRLENLMSVMDSIQFVQGDLRDPDAVAQAVQGMDDVLHQAALPSVPRSVADPLATHEVNATGTLNLLEAARDAGVRRFVYAGSSSAYGNTEVLSKREDMPAQPLSPYAVAKYCGESYARVFHRVYGLETICLRYFNVFGPRQDPENPYAAVVVRFLDALREGRAPLIHGDGRQSRDFTFVRNVVEANLRALDAGPQALGGLFNVACGQSHTLLDLLRHLQDLVGVRVEPHFDAPRRGDVRHSRACLQQSREILGYEPVVDFREGLAATVDWYLKRLAAA